MGLKERLEADMREAMRARDQRRLSAIRMLRAAITNYEIARTDRKNPQFGQPVTEEDLVGVLRKELAQRREALQFAEQANRQDLVEKERAELAALEPYLPRQLTREEIRQIVDLLLGRVKAQLAGQDMDLVVTDAAKDAIIEKGYDQAYGARPLRREIQNQIEDALAERMLRASFEAGDTVVVDVGPDGALTIERAAPPAKRQPAKAAR